MTGPMSPDDPAFSDEDRELLARWRNGPGARPCPKCPHLLARHSGEPGVGCLHESWCPCGVCGEHYTCPCTEPGTSEADQ